MTLAEATRWQNWVGRLGALCCALFVLAAMDALLSHFRQPINHFDLLAGDSVSINGNLPVDVHDLQELTFRSDLESLEVSFEAIHAGFWMGGNMWRGSLHVGPSAPAGSTSVTVGLKNKPSEKPLATFVIQVHATRELLTKSSKSLIRSNLDLSPWVLFGCCFGLAGLAFAGVYVLTEKRDALMAAEGRAEIYRMAKTDGCYEVAFGLGSRHGVRVGDALRIEAGNGETIGTVRVMEVFEEDSTGEVDLDSKIKPGNLVSRTG